MLLVFSQSFPLFGVLTGISILLVFPTPQGCLGILKMSVLSKHPPALTQLT